MIIGIGVDIAETSRVERLLREYGDRFASRILTTNEFAEFTRRGRSCAYLATRFAAKEATVKAMGTGIGRDLGFHSIEISHDSKGKPKLAFLQQGDELCKRMNITNALISLSDEKHYVVAMVVLES